MGAINVLVVMYRDADPEAALRCRACPGTGKLETRWGSGVFEACTYCQGSGLDPEPGGYVYSVQEPVAVGDQVVIPPSTYYPTEKIGTVVKVGASYAGYVRQTRVIQAA